jgi:competence protein ComEA
LLPAAACALELNDASRAELERLDGLGVVMVERILAERDKAPFRNWRDFEARVKGIRGARAERLRAQGLTIGGRRDERDDVGTSNKP